MKKFAEITGREYKLFDYVGAPDAEHVIIMMGSGAETAEETINYLVGQGEKVGLVKVRLYRPFSARHVLEALPLTTKRIAVLDRTKEPGAASEPLYQDVLTALHQAAEDGLSPFVQTPKLVGGRYGLSSKEFTPSMVKAVFENLTLDKPRNRFTVGILDDVTRLSLHFDPEFDIEPDDVTRCVFFGLGSDGTVGANKNSIKIISEETDHFAQGYFVYDSKKSGAITISHLRFGPRPIQSPYLIRQAQFVAVHQFGFFGKYDVVSYAQPGGTLLINAPYPTEQVWDMLPAETQEAIIEKQLKVYTIDAASVAQDAGMGRRINTVMQTCFFAISGVLPRDEAIAQIKKAIKKTYARKGDDVVQKNFEAVDSTLAHLNEITYASMPSSQIHRMPPVHEDAPDFVKRVTATILAGQGDLLPVSAFPVDGTWPTGTSKWEKRAIALEIPVWEPELCIQCNKCAMVCPHAAIRPKYFEPSEAEGAPSTFKTYDFKSPEHKGFKYALQVAPEDCTGCTLCVMVCPAKDKKQPTRKAINMAAMEPLRAAERENYEFFLNIPAPDRKEIKMGEVKSTQFLEPLFEYSGACSGCGEAPYIKLMTQMFGDRAVIANATGCSSIFGGNLPTTPYTKNAEGRGPAWANSLFEDNAEFGLGMRLAVDKQSVMARELVQILAPELGDPFVDQLLNADQSTEAGIEAQRERVDLLKYRLASMTLPQARRLTLLADYLVRQNVWIVGGDGWAYDIGYGGLDHVLASGADVNIMVLDTEVYSNTGGQSSKATPLGAAAKFAAAGKASNKKNLALAAINYGNVYVAQVAFGAKDSQTVLAFKEAESYPGPSLIIAYGHCIAHGFEINCALEHQKVAVESGYWPLFRFDPRKNGTGVSPFHLDSTPPKRPISDFMNTETRFKQVQQQNADRYEQLIGAAQQHVTDQYAFYQALAAAGTGTGSGSSN
jgi:pyruvate-ferredoxin/flavodoxin oxidoreductase